MPATYEQLRFSPQKRRRLGENRTCPQCGSAFYLPPARVARGEVYCSRKCLSESAPRIEKVCPACGKTFSVFASTAHRYTVCSRECRLSTTKYVSCKRCGKMFRAEKNLNRHYCSEECRRPPQYRDCRSCGTRFRFLPGDTDRQFCCFSCYRRFTGENHLEARVREALISLGIEFIQEARMGRYSIDFLIPNMRTALEIDGAYWHQIPDRDAKKDMFLFNKGWRVIRIGDNELADGVNCAKIISERFDESIY